MKVEKCREHFQFLPPSADQGSLSKSKTDDRSIQKFYAVALLFVEGLELDGRNAANNCGKNWIELREKTLTVAILSQWTNQNYFYQFVFDFKVKWTVVDWWVRSNRIFAKNLIFRTAKYLLCLLSRHFRKWSIQGRKQNRFWFTENSSTGGKKCGLCLGLKESSWWFWRKN